MSRRAAARVLILGGGFAGLAAAEALGDDLSVTLVDASSRFEFLPNIHELVSGVKKPADLRLPIDRIVRRAGHRFVRGRVEAIDPAARRVHVEGRKPLSYDALIVALGGVNATHGVPGVEQHALPFKSVAQCARIGRELSRRARSRAGARIVIVGGGLEGVEALGEILRRHRAESGFEIELVEARGRLLPEAPGALDRAVRRLAAAHGVRLHTGAPVAEVRPDAVVLGTGDVLPAELTIWTGGPAPPPLLEQAGLAPGPGDWAPVSSTLQSRARPDVFVAGDAAALREPLAKQAYHALDMGRCAAANVTRRLAGREPRAFRPNEKPMLLSFGDLSGFLVAGERVLAGPALAAAKEAVYELVMAQLDRRAIWDVAPAALGRLARAGQELVRPSFGSPSALLRLGRLSLL